MLRPLLRRCVPQPLLAARARRHRRRLRRELGVTDLAALFAARHGTTVRRGTFAGLRYPTEQATAVDDLVAKLVGAYECELSDALAAAIGRGPRNVVNIGCGDGYYAAGLARRLPGAVVHAFDTDPGARSLCRRVASLNGVADRVRIEGECTRARLSALDLEGSFVLSDCEGAELELFNGGVLGPLRAASLVVELHPLAELDVERVFVARFGRTHEIELVHPRPRRPEDYPELSALSPGEAVLVLDELRGTPGSWAVLTPREP